MSEKGIFLVIFMVLFILSGCLFTFLISMLKPKEQIEPQPKVPRILLPTDKNIYTFTLDSELESEEWEMILNSGWSFITCTTEQRKEYSNCGPESPSYIKTYWHYVFHK
jgi:hypothetical protein